MAAYRIISDVIPGDTYKVVRSLDATPLSDAWFTIKRIPTQNDADAIVFAHIDYTISGLYGRIEDLPDGTTVINFVLAPTLTTNLDSSGAYFYDLKIKTAGGDIYTLETGKLFTGQNITFAPN